jgi:hypothetical protein
MSNVLNVSELVSTEKIRKSDPAAVIEVIESCKQIGCIQNNWRQRTVSVYEHPVLKECVFSIGRPFASGDLNGIVICVELKSDYDRAIYLYPTVEIYN